MARPTAGPKSPTPEEIEGLIDLLAPAIDEENQPLFDAWERLLEVLDWAKEQVSKRRLYSKKFQLKDKERTKLLKERLGEDYDHIVERAKEQATERLFDHVAEGQPDSEEQQEFSNERQEAVRGEND